jgi:hypothetical protein
LGHFGPNEAGGPSTVRQTEEIALRSPAATLSTLLLPLALLLPAPALGNEIGFLPGEEITLDIEWLAVRTGTAKIMVGKPQGNLWPVTLQARTEGLASLVNIQEHLVAYWDPKAKNTRGSDLAAVEMNDRHFDSARIDRDQGKATVRVLRKGKRKEKIHDVPKDVQDVTGALLFLRLQPLKDGERLEFPVFTNNRIFTLSAEVLAREAIDTPVGRFPTIKVRVRTGFSGKFSTKRDTFLWLTDDARRIPVKISAEFAVGSVVANLVGYQAGNEIAQR